MFHISEVKREAKSAMHGKYGDAILAILLLNAVAVAGIALLLGYIVIIGALVVSKNAMYLDIVKGRYQGTNSIYGGFKHFWRALKVVVLEFLIWLILLAVLCAFVFAALSGFAGKLFGGINIIASTIAVGFICLVLVVFYLIVFARLSMAFYLVVDRPELSARACIRESMRITKGSVIRLYLFWLSFLLWVIGCALTAGLLYLRFEPYFQTASANVYVFLSQKSIVIKAR